MPGEADFHHHAPHPVLIENFVLLKLLQIYIKPMLRACFDLINPKKIRLESEITDLDLSITWLLKESLSAAYSYVMGMMAQYGEA